jgi:CRP-like cAMP-binding protein
VEWALLASLSEVERSEVLKSARRRTFERGEVVFHEGDPADSLHLVVSGRLAVRSSIETGETATINVLSPGAFFGELSLLRDGEDRVRTASAVALEPVETLSLSAKAFRVLCEAHPQIERFLSALLAQRVEELSQSLLEALYVGLDRRVYRRLLELCEIYAPAADSATIALTQTSLADLVGGSRPSVNQVLQKLATTGIVALSRGTIEVLDVAALRQRSGL